MSKFSGKKLVLNYRQKFKKKTVHRSDSFLISYAQRAKNFIQINTIGWFREFFTLNCPKTCTQVTILKLTDVVWVHEKEAQKKFWTKILITSRDFRVFENAL